MPPCLSHGSGPRRVTTFYVPSPGDLNTVPQDAGIGYQGVGQFNSTAEKVLEGGVGYQGVGLFGAAGSADQAAAVSYQGVGQFNASAQKVLEGGASYQGVGQFNASAGLTFSAAVGYAGVGQFSGAGQKVLEAVLGFATSAFVSFSGGVVYDSSVGFVGAGYVVFNGTKVYEAVSESTSIYTEVEETVVSRSVLVGMAASSTEVDNALQIVGSSLNGSATVFTQPVGAAIATTEVVEGTTTYTEVQ